jgi:glucose-1-phosphate cytidylyltransferase
VVILAGGLGTRLSEETHLRPKPMIEIGGQPILWHIMKIYDHYGLRDFIICLGYKGYVIKEYFSNYTLHRSDVTFDFARNTVEYSSATAEPWRITLVETGEATMTGGRLKRVSHLLNPNESFCLTYGDGVADLEIGKLVAFHESHGRLATLTAIAPPGRYGAITTRGNQVVQFTEKPGGDGAQINGGFFVLNPKVIDRIAGDEVPWERAPLESLARDGELMSYHHQGFWLAMDTLRDKNQLERLWESGHAPWKVWP